MNLATDVQTSNEWHVLKGEAKFGPYSYGEMIQMLQNKTVFGFDYAWSPHLESWTALSELTEFSPDRLSRLSEKSENQHVFNQRSNERAIVSLPVVCHDNSKVWTGVCENLSAGGALILMENPVLLPGNLITVHFKATNEKEQSFNCVSEIINKRLTKQRIQHDTGLHYAVKFVQTNSVGDTQVKKWVQNQLKDTKNKI